MAIDILMVEDSPLDAELIERALRRSGLDANVQRVTTGPGCIGALRAGRPDIVICDHNLPQFDGRDALRIVRALPDPPPFILITGSLDEETAVEYMKSGAADYILKDRLTRLGEAVKTAIERDRDRRATAEAERARREAEQRLGLLVRATNDAVWDLDLVHWTLQVNGEFLALIGHATQRGPLTLDAWHDCIHPEDRARVRAGLDTVLASRTNFWTDEYRLRRADGTYARVVDRALVMRNAQHEPVRVVGALVDVTERQRLHEQLLQSQKLEAVGRLAGGVAHDFNNVLTGILASTHLLDDSLRLRGEDRAELEEIRRGVDRAATLTAQLLAFSRKRMITLRNVDVNEVVRGVGGMLQRVIGEDVQLLLVLADGLGAVRADPGQLEQILVNLAVNARDAMPSGGTLSIATEAVDLEHDADSELEPGPYVALTVTDTGHGMDAVTQERIFEPFFTTKEAGHGTGLGLSTVYGIARQHGGRISVRSAPGNGTTFTLHLPRVDGPPVPHPVAESSAVARGTGTILLVEDDRIVRTTTTRILTRLGYSVTPVPGVDEAYACMLRDGTTVDLIVSDIVLADSNGIALVQRLRQAGFDTPVLFLSGYAEDIVLREADLPARSAFLPKPYTPAVLSQRVGEMLATFGAARDSGNPTV
jgi:two-component system, cell cycle sensor histidine kinase and response regulator CckA